MNEIFKIDRGGIGKNIFMGGGIRYGVYNLHGFHKMTGQLGYYNQKTSSIFNLQGIIIRVELDIISNNLGLDNLVLLK